jgi:putative ABC transport system substrate-binding protein
LLFAHCHSALGQQSAKIYRIVLVQSSSAEEAFIVGFTQGMKELGYIEGKHFTLESHAGHTNAERLLSIATERVRMNPDVVIAAGGPAIAAFKRATSTIPIVMRVGSDPVRAGYIASLAHPGGNITGVASINLGLIGKRLELLMELSSDIKRIAVLSAQSNPAAFMATDEYKEMQAAARALGVELQMAWARTPTQIDEALLAMPKERRPQALTVIPSPRYLEDREFLVKRVGKTRLPAIYPHNLFVKDGGLMSYGPDFADEYRRMAVYVHKILNGAKPADLPVEQPKKFELVINLKTAKQIGLTVPPHVLARADRVIR